MPPELVEQNQAPTAPVKYEPRETTLEDLQNEFGEDVGGVTATDDGDKEAPAPKAPAKENAEETADADADEDLLEEEGDDATQGDEEPATAEAKKLKNVEAQLAAATKRAEEADRKVAELTAGDKKSEAAEEIKEDEEPNPDDYDFGEADPKYIADAAKYAVRNEIRIERAKEQMTAQVAALDARWDKNVVEAKTRYADFDEVVVKGAAEQKWSCPPVISVGIKSSDYGADVAYELASNPEKAAKLAEMEPLEQAREFGRMEMMHELRAKKRISSAASAPKTTAAPNPPKHKVRGAGGSFQAAPDTDDFEAFERMADRSLSGGTN